VCDNGGKGARSESFGEKNQSDPEMGSPGALTENVGQAHWVKPKETGDTTRPRSRRSNGQTRSPPIQEISTSKPGKRVGRGPFKKRSLSIKKEKIRIYRKRTFHLAKIDSVDSNSVSEKGGVSLLH